MKNLTLIILAICLQYFTANAQQVDVKDVPDTVISTFKFLYPLVKDVKWERGENNYLAKFSRVRSQSNNIKVTEGEKVEKIIFITPEGGLIKSETKLKITNLPPKINDYIKVNYPKNNIIELTEVINAKRFFSYRVRLDGIDLIFDVSGKFLKEIKD